MRTAATVALTCLLPLTVSTLTGCHNTPPRADLAQLYNRAANAPEEYRAPVIVIPGILGTELIDADSGQIAWGAFTGNSIDPTTPEGARIMALPMVEGAPLADLSDDVRRAGALETFEVDILGIPFELSAYVDILTTLGVGGYRDRPLGESGAISYGPGHYTCDQYDYDWRKDISQHAEDLHEYVVDVAEYVQGERGLDELVKLNIVAHSMGGLVARYYLRYGPTPLPDDGSLPPLTWEGAKYIERLIMVGTPNAGSALSLTQLVNGYDIAPFLPSYNPAILGTFPSIYQLLPRPRHGAVVDADSGEPIDFYDPAEWEARGWGLASPDLDDKLAELLPDASSPAERRAIALDQLRKSLARAEQFHRAVDRPASPPEGLEIVLIAGDVEDTAAVLEADPRRGTLRIAERTPGDGTVTRDSALMDERLGRDWVPGLRSPIDFESVLFLANNHLGLTKDPNFSNNVLYLLLEAPTGGPADIEG